MRRGRVPTASRIALVITLVGAAALAFVLAKQMSQIGYAGVDYLVWVQDVPANVRVEDVTAAVARASSGSGADIAKDVVDPRSPVDVRHLYLQPTHATPSGWLDAQRYPDFSRDVTTLVHPLEELPADAVRGYYNVYGPASAAESLSTELRELGVGVVEASYPSLLWLTLDESVRSGMLIGLIALAVLSGFAVLAQAKRYGIQRMHGQGFGGILVGDTAAMLRFLTPCAAAVVVAAIGMLYFYNGWNQLFEYLQLLVLLVGAGLTIIAIAHVTALSLVFRVPAIRALKGEFASATSIVIAYLARVAALLVTLAIAFATIDVSAAFAQRSRAEDALSQVKGSVYLMIDGSLTKGRAELDGRLGGMIQSADLRGDVVVCATQEIVVSTTGGELRTEKLVIVNQAYLSRFPLNDENGRSISADEQKPVIAVPPRLSGDEPAMRAAVNNWTTMISGGSSPSEIAIATSLAANQYAMTLGDLADPGSSVDVVNPLVLVLPTQARVLTNDMWSAYATTAGVYFIDSSLAEQAISDADLCDYVLALNPVGQNAAVQLRELTEAQSLNVVSLLVAGGVVMMSGLAVGLIYCRRFQQAIFAKHTLGWTFLMTHKWIVAIEAALLVAVSVWWVARIADDLAVSRSLGPRDGPPRVLELGGFEPVIAAAVIGASLIVMLVTIAGIAQRTIRTRATGA
jgi:hypothetical protein